jgi:hypothetical protein
MRGRRGVITSPIYRTRSFERRSCNGLVAGISRDESHVLFSGCYFVLLIVIFLDLNHRRPGA